ncbi:MAG: hypothetical protein BMS9Abin29_0209 [Gemmatimonadota bacterium]|nr:MAG: hypothetical protein BMS9Abin29_0209 [Gemmatimonadota bacterium]
MRTRDLGYFGLALALPMAFAACAAGDEAADAAEEAVPAAEEAAVTLPELSADGVWEFLTNSDYETWDRWPGTTDQYDGAEPHGAKLTTYVNDVAAAALASGEAIMPVGAIVVKNNYMPDGMLAAVTAMVKTEDFNPDNNNWWFLKRLTDGTVQAAGRFAGCEGCHGTVAATDYLFNDRPAGPGQ